MSNYMKQPLLENMRSNLYSFYTDETSDVTSIEQLAIYATFLRNQPISEHFIGLIPISKEVGAHLSAVNIMSALENFFVKNDINNIFNKLVLSVWTLQTSILVQKMA